MKLLLLMGSFMLMNSVWADQKLCIVKTLKVNASTILVRCPGVPARVPSFAIATRSRQAASQAAHDKLLDRYMGMFQTSVANNESILFTYNPRDHRKPRGCGDNCFVMIDVTLVNKK